MWVKLKSKISKPKETEHIVAEEDDYVASLLEGNDKEEDIDILRKGVTTMMGIISPDGVDPTERDIGYIQDGIGTERVFQPIYITRGGWPRKIKTTCFHTLIHCPDTDVMMYFEKFKRKEAIKKLQRKITVLRSNLDMELKRGNNDQIFDLTTKISDADTLQSEISIGMNDMFHVGVVANIYADNEEDLNDISTKLLDSLAGENFNARVAYNRIKYGFVSGLPIGRNYVSESFRNLDRYAAASLYPFATNDLRYTGPGAIPWGINMVTGNYIYFDPFYNKGKDRNPNYNMAIFGVSGSGKTFAMNLLTARSLIENISTIAIDPEGEMKDLFKQIGGIYISIAEERISEKRPITINPCALWPSVVILDDEDDDELEHIDSNKCEVLTDQDGRTIVKFVAINEKINEILGFFEMLVKDEQKPGLNSFERDFVEQAIVKVFRKRGFNEHPSSLYEEQYQQAGQIHMNRVRKPEVTISDIYKQLTIDFGDNPRAEELLAAIRPYLAERIEIDRETNEEVTIRGSKGMFDGQSYFGEGIDHALEESMLVGFDLSALEANERLQQIVYHVITGWAWEKFVKGNPFRKKRIILDEAWKCVDQPIYLNFVEKAARRARKRNCSLTIASQDFQRLANNEKARGVISNCHSVLFMRQDNLNRDLVKQTFNLSEGEISKVLGDIPPGEGILRVGNQSVWMNTFASDEEKYFLESNKAHREELKKRKAGEVEIGV